MVVSRVQRERMTEVERHKKIEAAFYERALREGKRCRSDSPGGEMRCEGTMHHPDDHWAHRRANSITDPGRLIKWSKE